MNRLKESLEIDSNNPLALGNLGYLYHYKIKDFDKAEEYYLKSINQFPTQSSILLKYAIFLKQIRKNYEKAEKYFKLVL